MNKQKNKSLKLKLGNRQNVWCSLFLLFFLITSCKISGNKTSEQNIESNGDTEYNSVKSLVQNWNKTHQYYDFTAMQKIYSDKVLYYGKEMTNQDIVLAKQSFIKKNNDFTQSILGDLTIENLSDLRIKVSFIKQASFGGKRNEYPSYLELQKTDSEWKICTESDNITDKNLAKRREIKSSLTVETIKRAFIKNNNVFVEFADNKEKQLTYNGKDREPIIIDANTVFFIRKQFDIDDNEVNVLMTVDVDMLKDRVIKTVDSYFIVENPILSNDKKHIYYTSNISATENGLVKLNIYNGESQDLFAGDWYHEIISGDFKGYFLVYTYGWKDGQLGRQYYYRLCNSNGAEYLTFDNKAAMYDFARANNINLDDKNTASKETQNTQNQNETIYTTPVSFDKGTYSMKYLYVESKGWTSFRDDDSNSKVSIGTHNSKEFRAHKTFVEVQDKKILFSVNNKIERILRFNKTLTSTKEREDTNGKYKYITYEGTVSVGEYGSQNTGQFEYGTIVKDNQKYQYIKTFEGLDAIFIF
jgi:hypothetical protein